LNSGYLRKERLFVGFFLFSICCNLAHLIHQAWFEFQVLSADDPLGNKALYFLFPTTPKPLHAPEAYRLAIPALGRFFLQMFRLKDPSVVAGALDFVFGFFALYFFYRVATDGLSITKGERTKRTLVVAMLLAFVQFPMAWVIPRQRPETLPTAFFLASALFCLARVRRGAIWTGLLLAVAVWQSFVRGDVVLVFGAALVLMSLWGGTLDELGPRSHNVLRGVCITVIAAGVQGYLQLVRYPHLSYWPGVEVVQFRHNLNLHQLGDWTVALFPFLVLAAYLMLKRVPLRAVDAIVIASSILYLPAWFSVGVIAEVRIYVPFMLALSLVAARTASSYLTQDDATS